MVNSKELEIKTSLRIKSWRDKLLDTSLANPLLSMRKVSGISIINPDQLGLFDKILSGDVSSIMIKSWIRNNLVDHINNEESLTSEDVISGTKKLKRSDIKISDLKSIYKKIGYKNIKKDDLIVLNADAKKLQSALARMEKASRSSMEDSGIHTLYISMGTVYWTPEGKSVKSEAPLVLVPVKLKRDNIRSDFELHIVDSDIILNPAFENVSKSLFSINWSAFKNELLEEKVSLDRLKSSIPNMPPDWSISADSRLIILSYAKHRMWQDLEDMESKIKEHDFIKALIDPSQSNFEVTNYSDTEWSDVDSEKVQSELCLPLPADASQVRAITRAVNGSTMVIQGPPGTGKSQTITNMICSILAKDKTILFVAEKMTALSVVHDKMIDIGIGEYCLELHARVCDRKNVLNQINESLEAVKPPEPTPKRAPIIEGKLNKSLEFMHKKTNSGFTLYEAIGRQAILRSSYENLEEISNKSGLSFKDALHDSYDTVNRRRLTLKEFLKSIELMPKNAEIFNDFKVDEQQYGEFWSSVNDCVLNISTIEQKIKCDELFNINILDVEHLILWQQQTRPTSAPDDSLFTKDVIKSFSSFKDADEAYSNVWSKWSPMFKSSVFQDAEIINDLPEKKSILSIFKINKIKNQLKQHQVNSKDDLDFNILLNFKKSWKQLESSRNYVSSKASLLKIACLDAGFKTQKLSEINEIISSWLKWSKARSNIQSVMSSESKKIAEKNLIGISDLEILLSNSKKIIFFNKNLENKSVEFIYNKAKLLKSAKQSWITYLSYLETKNKMISDGLGQIVNGLENGLIPNNLAEAVLDDVFFSDLAQHLRWDSPEFELAIGHKRTSLIEELAAARKEDEKSAICNLKNKLFENSRIPNNSTLKNIVKKEMLKKKKIISPRNLIHAASEQLTKIKPCLFMSPISAAEFLSDKNIIFDVVIFDESSQIPTADAAGVIARAKQVIVVGDPKQMPPSKGFSKSIDDEFEDEEYDSSDLESILSESLAASVPSVTLNWHYRSKHEDLIAFSNRNYYNGELITFPSPKTNSAFTVHQINGLYDRGKTGTNSDEAIAVADKIEELVRLNSGETIGVVTFNQRQQHLIERLWDEKMSACPELEVLSSKLKDPISIKSLENVQGDERDIILFSTTFGKDASGKFIMNFGPLAQSGGERRLNVAITRAKIHMHVFTSFETSDINDSKLSNQGVKDLKAWLTFIKGGEKELASMTTKSLGLPDSPFEISVANELKKKGWKVTPQVGCSGYKIDIAVNHPNIEGKYLAAIECDGATYHSFKSARDRDYQRQKILEGLGWNVLRIWSTDWFEDRASEIERIHQQLLKIL